MPMVFRLPDFDFGFSPPQYHLRIVTKQRCQTKGHPLFTKNSDRSAFYIDSNCPASGIGQNDCAPDGGTYIVAGQLVPHVFEPDCDIRAVVRKSVQLRCFHQSSMFRFGGANNPCTNMFHCRQCALGTIRRRNGDLHLAHSYILLNDVLLPDATSSRKSHIISL